MHKLTFVKCQQCGKLFRTFPSFIKSGHGKFCSRICYGKYKRLNREKINYAFGSRRSDWKGDKVSYKCLHKWINRWYGKADRCDGDNCSGESNHFHWANKSGKYLRDIKDWIKLCSSCHAKFDKINVGRKRDWHGRWF